MDEFVGLQAESTGVGHVLAGLAEVASDLLGLAGGGVVTEQAELPAPPPAAAAQTVSLDRLSRLVSDGPCADSLTRGNVTHVTSVADHAAAWPGFAAEASRAGVESLAAFPLRHGGHAIGCLVLVSDRPRCWHDDEIEMVRVLSDMASVHAAQQSTLHHFQRLAGQLERALECRVVVEQAKGIIANANRSNVDAAYRLIRQYARSHNATVQAVAEAIVSLGLRV